MALSCALTMCVCVFSWVSQINGKSSNMNEFEGVMHTLKNTRKKCIEARLNVTIVHIWIENGIGLYRTWMFTALLRPKKRSRKGMERMDIEKKEYFFVHLSKHFIQFYPRNKSYKILPLDKEPYVLTYKSAVERKGYNNGIIRFILIFRHVIKWNREAVAENEKEWTARKKT